MPSSSSHSTEQETALHDCWRLAYVRLHAIADRVGDADYLTQEFARVLDINFEDLINAYWPPGPVGMAAVVAQEERSLIQAIAQAGRQMHEARKLADAAYAVGSASEALTRFGRDVEAHHFGKMAETIHAESMRLYESESESEGDDEPNGRAGKRQT